MTTTKIKSLDGKLVTQGEVYVIAQNPDVCLISHIGRRGRWCEPHAMEVFFWNDTKPIEIIVEKSIDSYF